MTMARPKGAWQVVAENDIDKLVIDCKTITRARRIAYRYKVIGYHTQILKVKEN